MGRRLAVGAPDRGQGMLCSSAAVLGRSYPRGSVSRRRWDAINVPSFGLPLANAVPVEPYHSSPTGIFIDREKRLLVQQGSTLSVVAGGVAVRTADPLWAQAMAAGQKAGPPAS